MIYLASIVTLLLFFISIQLHVINQQSILRTKIESENNNALRLFSEQMLEGQINIRREITNVRSAIHGFSNATDDGFQALINIQTDIKSSTDHIEESTEKIRRLTYDACTVGIERVLTSIDKANE